jgi:hypothetical protein
MDCRLFYAAEHDPDRRSTLFKDQTHYEFPHRIGKYHTSCAGISA